MPKKKLKDRRVGRDEDTSAKSGEGNSRFPLSEYVPQACWVHVCPDGSELRFEDRPVDLPVLWVGRRDEIEFTRTWNRAPADIPEPRRLYSIRPPGRDWELKHKTREVSVWIREAQK